MRQPLPTNANMFVSYWEGKDEYIVSPDTGLSNQHKLVWRLSAQMIFVAIRKEYCLIFLFF